ncbi:MAG: glycosyltransferase involved in cell wall biosynthesis [Saprospiraceae bacterium]|jgi:glycosyltransferase involved in cell wall biosynthesis
MISILLPVYNAAPFLEECLNSILQQTETDWELLAVNDFSTDNSFEILKKHAATDSRIHALQNIEKGIISALRTAHQNASGSYITRMDADDRMMPDKLKTLKNLLVENGEGHVSTGLVQYFSEKELGEGYQRYEAWLNELTQGQSNFSEIYKECVIPSPCWMVSRGDLEKCGAFHPNDYPEDYDLCFRFYKKGLKVVGTDGILHQWRDHTARTSRNNETYANNQYFDLKLPYFLELDYQKERPLVLWGAGKKGKRIARMLEKNGTTFHWVCNTESKWGHIISSAKMKSTEAVKELDNPQIIVAVAAPEGQVEILDFMEKNNLKKGWHYFFFC